MNPIYVFGGYLLTGGTLENGNPWQGVNVLLAMVKDMRSVPCRGEISKASRSDTLLQKLESLKPGMHVNAVFDIKGRLIDIAPARVDGSRS